jgi:hypothetical protein
MFPNALLVLFMALAFMPLILTKLLNYMKNILFYFISIPAGSDACISAKEPGEVSRMLITLSRVVAGWAPH